MQRPQRGQADTDTARGDEAGALGSALASELSDIVEAADAVYDDEGQPRRRSPRGVVQRPVA
jgi:hypothetical protein